MAPGLFDLGRDWWCAPTRPRPASSVISAWDGLIEDWIASELPLPIRKPALGRGRALEHPPSGRILTPSDNTIANWVMDLALRGEVPTLAAVRELFATARMPLAMILKTTEKSQAVYARRGLRAALRPNELGWKVCHIEAVGLGASFRPDACSVDVVTAHVRLLLSPRNMFLIPLGLGGLGEVQAFIDGFRQAQSQEMSHALDR